MPESIINPRDRPLATLESGDSICQRCGALIEFPAEECQACARQVTPEQRVALDRFLKTHPGAIFIAFGEVLAGALTRRPRTGEAFWTITNTGSLMTFGGRPACGSGSR